VSGASKGLVARGEDALRETARAIRECTGGDVRYVACDITTERGREAALIALQDPDILVTNAGGPPPGDFRQWDREHWISALDANMLAPIALIRATTA
jgi:3-oxoacyl-[acyl-carrier protein] reductase